jgi:hypothetical protein
MNGIKCPPCALNLLPAKPMHEIFITASELYTRIVLKFSTRLRAKDSRILARIYRVGNAGSHSNLQRHVFDFKFRFYSTPPIQTWQVLLSPSPFSFSSKYPIAASTASDVGDLDALMVTGCI